MFSNAPIHVGFLMKKIGFKLWWTNIDQLSIWGLFIEIEHTSDHCNLRIE